MPASFFTFHQQSIENSSLFPSNQGSYQICDHGFGSLICQLLQRLSYFILSCIQVQNNPYKYIVFLCRSFDCHVNYLSDGYGTERKVGASFAAPWFSSF